ncbi:MAG TPA: helix-turn-helix transcriptional regulator [Terriglobia bacterium]|nr:helix-turn-helix transcriptional regulator [Terriglobia bacterium]
MKPRNLKAARLKHGWRQVEAARRLHVSQPYLAMLEKGKRRLTDNLARKAARVYGLSPEELPVPETFTPAREAGAARLVEDLSRLDYPGFAYVRSHVKRRNPREVLLNVLAQENLEARVAEALPWLLLQYWRMDFDWLVEQAKRCDLQNRLGFVASLARRLSERTAETERTRALSSLEAMLDRSRLVREGSFPRAPRNPAEREWLMHNRPEEARHWNMLSDLQPEHLQYVE